MKNIRQRHWAVDIGFLVAGCFISSAITHKSVMYFIAGCIITIGTIWHDTRNIIDEEKELN